MTEKNIQEKKPRSVGKIIIGCIFAAILLAIWAIPIIKFIIIACENVTVADRYAWLMFTGWTVIFIIQLFYDNPSRRLMISLFKAIRAASKWDADSWFLQLFLWFLLYTYGIIVSVAAAAFYAPVSAVLKAVTGK